LYTLSALGAGLAAMAAPGAAALSLGVGTSGALWGVLAALAVLALQPIGLPLPVGERLRKIVGANLVLGIVLTLLPSVDRVAHLGGAGVGVVLMALGILRPLRIGDDLLPVLWRVGQLVLGVVCGVLLLGSLATALLVGRPWQPDRSWKQRLGTAVKLGGDKKTAGGGAAGSPAKGDAASPPAELKPVRRTLGEAGYSIVLPESLGEARALTDAGKIPVFQFGELGGQLQALDVVVQRQQRPLKNKAQLQQALDQNAALVRADKLKGDAKELTPAARSTLDGQPWWTFHVRLQESIQGKAAVLVRRDAVIVLWYVYSDLLPDSLQLELTAAAKSVKDEFAGFGSGKKANKTKTKKKGRR
jgi:hypothetical protein